jgi:mono/diheme cytochrome c family protein
MILMASIMASLPRLLLVLASVLSLTALAQDPSGNPVAGKAIFQKNCSVCHGSEGHGDGPAASGFNPRPANFLEDRRLATPEQKQIRIVTNGGPSEKLSAVMPAFEDALSPQEVRDAVAFIRLTVQAPAREVAAK